MPESYKNHIKVDVIVPVYNTAGYLMRCYESLKNQTLDGVRIILVDDGSTDASGNICDEIAARDTHVLVVHKENGGPGSARNAGIDASAAEYVAFVDSDDSVEPEMYEILYNAAKESDADMVLSGLRHIGGIMFGNRTDELRSAFEKRETFEGEEGVKELLLGTVGALPEESEDSRYGFSSCKDLFRQSLLKECNIRYPSEKECICEDAVFLVDYISRINRAVGIPGDFYNYFRREGSLSKAYKSGKFKQFRILIDELEKRLSAILNKEEYQLYLDRQFEACARIAAINEIMVGGDDVDKRLKAICCDEKLSECLKRYPWTKLPLKQAVFAGAMRYRMTGLMKFLVKARSKG